MISESCQTDILQLDGNDSVNSESSPTNNPTCVRPDKITSALSMPVVAFLCEIWEKSENKMHQQEIENMLESEGLKYLSTARPTGWGGAAIIVNLEKFSIEKLNISNPHNLEIIWGLVKPKDATATFKKL